MAYAVNVNKAVKNVKVFTVKKRIKNNPNALSKFVQSLIDKYVLKGKGETAQ